MMIINGSTDQRINGSTADGMDGEVKMDAIEGGKQMGMGIRTDKEPSLVDS
jgi:hypothetical protein